MTVNPIDLYVEYRDPRTEEKEIIPPGNWWINEAEHEGIYNVLTLKFSSGASLELNVTDELLERLQLVSTE